VLITNVGGASLICGGTAGAREIRTFCIRKGTREGNCPNVAARARARKLAPEEMQDGTFSISNLGMFGIDEFENGGQTVTQATDRTNASVRAVAKAAERWKVTPAP